MQGVPGVLPSAPGIGLRVEDDEVQAEAAQVVSGGEPGLAPPITTTWDVRVTRWLPDRAGK
jgi:hypothetical protein